jgi:acyl dehydratase
VRALVGVEKTRRVHVTANDIKRFAQAIGATDPVHHDEEHARTTRHGRIVAPPLFCQSLTYEDAPPEQLGADGSPVEINLDIPATRAVGGSSAYRINRLVGAGETITVVSRLAGVDTKQGRSGTLYLVVVETDFRDEGGELVAAETATYIKRP